MAFTEARQLIVRLLREYESVKFVGDALKQLDLAESEYAKLDESVKNRQLELKRLEDAIASVDEAYAKKRQHYEANLRELGAKMEAELHDRKASLAKDASDAQNELERVVAIIAMRKDELEGLDARVEQLNAHVERLQTFVAGVAKNVNR